MSSSTLPSSEDPSPQEREKIDNFLGEIQGKIEILMRERSSSDGNAQISRLEVLLREKDEEISMLREQLSNMPGIGGEIFDKLMTKIKQQDNSNLKKELKEARARIKELEEDGQKCSAKEEKKCEASLSVVDEELKNYFSSLDSYLFEQEKRFIEMEEEEEEEEEISELKAKISELEADLTDAHEQIGILELRENDAETTQIIVEELREAKKAMEQMITVQKEMKSSNKALERSLRKEINKIGASLGQCRAQKADVERKLKEAQEKIEVLESRDVRGHTRSPDDRRSGPSQRYLGGANRDVRRPYDRYDTRRSSPDHSPVRRYEICPNSRAAARDVRRPLDSYDTILYRSPSGRISQYRVEPTRRDPRDERERTSARGDTTRDYDRHGSSYGRGYSPVRRKTGSSSSRRTPAASDRRPYEYDTERIGSTRPGSGFAYNGRGLAPRGTIRAFAHRGSRNWRHDSGRMSDNRRPWSGYWTSTGFQQQSDDQTSDPQTSGFPRAQESDNQGSSTMAGPSEVVFSSRQFGSAPSESVVAENDRAETSDSEDDDW